MKIDEKTEEPSADLQPVLEFLRGLRDNNNRSWFTEHKKEYEEVRSRFESFIERLMNEIGTFDDLGATLPKDCIFRINRDVRFSKDKSPYKSTMSAAVAPGGRKFHDHSYYIHIEPDGLSMIAGGLYQPSTPQIAAFRAHIASDAAAFRSVIESKDFVHHFQTVQGDRLKSAPPGYKKEHPEIELLQLKQVLAVRKLADAEVTKADFVTMAADACRAMKPFHDYLAAVLQDVQTPETKNNESGEKLLKKERYTPDF